MVKQMNDTITLTIPAKPDYLLTARLTASSVASRMGFDINDVEDIKTAAAESMLIIMQCKKYSDVTIEIVNTGSELMASVVGVEGSAPYIDIENDDNSLGRYLIEALADESIFEETDGQISRIRFKKKLQR
jgi:serine/threonine-protein kinase RsbW